MVEEVKDWSWLYREESKQFSTPITIGSLVVHGFGRGSKELGIPTANLNMETLSNDNNVEFNTGIYYGWARLNGAVYNTVVSIGYNPVYNNTHKTIEAHIIDKKLDDFYGDRLDLFLVGYLRNERNFSSLEDLISCIHADINYSIKQLELLENDSEINSGKQLWLSKTSIEP